MKARNDQNYTSKEEEGRTLQREEVIQIENSSTQVRSNLRQSRSHARFIIEQTLGVVQNNKSATAVIAVVTRLNQLFD